MFRRSTVYGTLEADRRSQTYNTGVSPGALTSVSPSQSVFNFPSHDNSAPLEVWRGPRIKWILALNRVPHPYTAESRFGTSEGYDRSLFNDLDLSG